jgi:cell division protein FtsB
MTSKQHVVWGAAAVALALAIVSMVAEGGFRRSWRLKADVRALQDRNVRLADENARLAAEVKALQSDNAAIERAAREELGFVKPGEVVFNVEGSR